MKKKIKLFIFLIAAFLIYSWPAYGQGFMVKPMKMEIQSRAGQSVEKILELRNTTANETLILDLKLMELTQGKTGAWWLIDPGSNIDTSNLHSCLKWIELSAQSVEVKPLEMVPVKINVRIPRSARGFYAAALIAQTKPSEPKEGRIRIGIVIRFLIPILVEIQGRPVRQKIELSDADLEFFEQSEENPATTIVSMNITNKGGTYSRLKGNLNVMWQTGEYWQRVTSADFPEVGIIPGIELNLKSDLERRLPSGKYKLTGTLYVDGRPIKPFIKEIEFVGDPTISKVIADTSLILEPSTLSMKTVPEGTRTSAIKVWNLSEETVNISVDVEVPESLPGVALGELTGEELSCARWVEVIPDNFTLISGRHRNIRVMARLPKSEKMYANYYATLVLHATYTDGQSAGKNTSLILLENTEIKAKPAAQIIKVGLAVEEGARYIIQAKSANVGNVHFTPQCKATVSKPDGTTVLEATLSGQGQVMLPLETRDFSGILDFSEIEEGIYRLSVLMDYAKNIVSKILPIQVSLEEGEKIVTVIAVNEK